MQSGPWQLPRIQQILPTILLQAQVRNRERGSYCVKQAIHGQLQHRPDHSNQHHFLRSVQLLALGLAEVADESVLQAQSCKPQTRRRWQGVQSGLSHVLNRQKDWVVFLVQPNRRLLERGHRADEPDVQAEQSGAHPRQHAEGHERHLLEWDKRWIQLHFDCERTGRYIVLTSDPRQHPLGPYFQIPFQSKCYPECFLCQDTQQAVLQAKQKRRRRWAKIHGLTVE